MLNQRTNFGLYRSGITPPDQLRHITIARTHIMEEMQSKLLGSLEKSSKQHSLFIGPRGAGKTHLLSLIEQEVGENPDLKERCIVVRFPEEPLRLISYVDFLMGICEILQDVLPPEEAEKWNRLYDQFIEEPDSACIRDTLEAEIRKTGRDQKRTLLIMLENFDTILTQQIDSRHASKKERKSHQEAAALRKWFMGDNGCMLIATAPLYFPGISDEKQPFYDFFDVQTLPPLTTEETLQLIRKNLEWEKSIQSKWLDEFDDLKPRILALHEMTGGNPRLIMMLYELITRESIIAVRDQFLGLLDRITPFYQDRIKELPPQERAILETMARMRKVKKTPAAIAARMRFSPQQTSSLLKRLADSLYLKSAPNPDDKRSRIYTIREGFFDLWLAMNLSRADRTRLPFLVEFFETWYRSIDERAAKRKSLYPLLEQPDTFENAAAELDHLSETGTAEEQAEVKIQLAKHLAKLGKPERSARYISEFKRLDVDGLGRWIVDHTSQWTDTGTNMFSELEAMISCWKTQRSGDLEAFAKRLQEMGGELNHKNYSEARIHFLTESLNHLTDPKMRIETRLSIANTLIKMAHFKEAEEQLLRAKNESKENIAHPFYSVILNNMAHLFQETNRLKEAEPLLRQALEINEEALDPNITPQLNNLAQLLQETNRLDEAEPLIRRALEIDEKVLGSNHPTVAIRLNNLALLLQETNRLKEAEPLMRRHVLILHRFQQENEYPHPHADTAITNYTGLLEQMGWKKSRIEKHLHELLG